METVSGLHQHVSLANHLLLTGNETIVVVDDDPAIREPLLAYFETQGFSVCGANNASELLQVLETHNVALILLDIGLPDSDGIALLPKLVNTYPDTAIVMLTGVADLHVAMECIRNGADDYLTKPAELNEILFVVKKVLEKRRLIFENRKYQEDLEKAHFRIHLLHQLALKMNTAYLNTVELDGVLRAILVGITANEGMRFNRAFLAMFDETGKILQGRMAIGPDGPAEAAHIWTQIQEKDLSFLDLVKNFRDSSLDSQTSVNRIITSLRIHVSNTQNILIKAALERRSVRITKENGCLPMPVERRNLRRETTGGRVYNGGDRRGVLANEGWNLPPPHEIIELLGEDQFVVVPLFSPSRSFGVIIADNFVTRREITESHVSALELFASQASLALEHSHHYMEMNKKIGELEVLNEELNKNKDLLVEAERYAALGHMAAQLVHAIRNPITSIGGVARILSKKTVDPEWNKYLNVMEKETARLESTLEDLFDFVTQPPFEMEKAPLYPIIEKSVMLVQNIMQKLSISWEYDFPQPEPLVNMDIRQMRQVMLHLVRNAIDAMPEGGVLSVVVRSADGHVVVSIMDTGVGINEANLERAKDPFFTTKTYGTGMGLAMVERVIKGHSGGFVLRRRSGGGTEARITLSLADQQV